MGDLPEQPVRTEGQESSRNAVRFDCTDWLTFGITSLAAWFIYLLTLAPEVTLHFSGMLLTSANYFGVSPPPGYPVWTLYSWLFVHLVPFGSVAWRVTLGSSVAVALASGLLAMLVSMGGKLLAKSIAEESVDAVRAHQITRVVCGYAAGMIFALSTPIWQMAVVAETWAISILSFSLLLFFLLGWALQPTRRVYL